jgi:hypothetical protein
MMLNQNNIKWYLIGTVLGLLIGAILYFVQPIKWKGQVLVRVGQISQNQNQNQNSSSVEPLPTVVERLKSRSFIQGVAERTKRVEIAALLNVDEGAGMTIRPTRNSDSLEIIVTGGSSELVRTAIDGVVAEVISKHDAILKAYQVDSRKELARLDSEIDALSKRMAVAAKKSSEGRDVMAGLLIMTTQPALEFKLNRASLLREAMSSANIRPTSALEHPSVSERRIFSSLWRACFFGALSGILLSALWIRWKNRAA